MQTLLIDTRSPLHVGEGGDAPRSDMNLAMFVAPGVLKRPAEQPLKAAQSAHEERGSFLLKCEGAYVCERCGFLCDSRAFTSCICPNCRWRVLRKLVTSRAMRVFTTD